MWAGSLGGLNVWLKNTDSFKTYKKGGTGSINDNIVRAIYQPSPEKLYVGTEQGLNVLDVARQTFTSYTNKSNDPHSISDNAVYSIYPDKEGGIWLGTFFGGINYFPEKGSRFELYYATGESSSLSGNAVSCFLEDKPGYFWVGTENGGLNYYDSHTKTFKKYPFTSSQQPLSYHNIHSLFKDDKQNLWIGFFSAGLNIYNPSTGQVKKYQHNPLDSNSLSNNNIYSIYKDKEGNIWIGTTEGLNVYDRQKDLFHRVYDIGLQHSLIYNIYEDDNSNIWFITYDNGLVGKNKKTNKWVRYSADGKSNSISSNKIISVLDDHAGNLWLGTDGGGLNCFNISSKTFKVYNEKQGISSIVYGILRDDNGELWLSTNNGIIKFSPQTQKSRVYTNLDNLQSTQFNYNAALKASDGKMYFGGINGFNAFYPDSLKDAKLSSYIAPFSIPAISASELLFAVSNINGIWL
jgi:ligand-binding sensor domain-containing protein